MENDSIAVFSIGENYSLTFLELKDTGGKLPRNFALSNDGDNLWVAVADEITQDIAIFERDTISGLVNGEKGRSSLGEIDKTRTKGLICILWDWTKLFALARKRLTVK
jgi:6-phosphogluconolactonase (cycloisomerase 2 family)